MRRLLARAPLWVVLATILSASMYVPALHAEIRNAHAEARAFFYWGTLLLAGCAAVALASAKDRDDEGVRGHLVSLLLTVGLVPVLAAIPVATAIGDTRPINAWLAMVAAATTTGGAVFDAERLSSSLHLWRALVAWQGGLLLWVAAAAILAPLRLGGFELTQKGDAPMSLGRDRLAKHRIGRAARALAPVYGGLTLSLWAILSAAGIPPTDAAIYAMSTLATSGIVGATPFHAAPAGILAEIAVLGFLLFAITRVAFTTDLQGSRIEALREDRELRIALLVTAAVTALLFARHWIGAFEVEAATNLRAALAALWGGAFTTISFLTTTGFVSAEWEAARTWSGLGTSQVLLLGLAMFGGGVATTAGGVKLLRIYALYAHGRREMQLLVHPHSIVTDRRRHRITEAGIEAAWVFFMLFAVAIAGATLALAMTGLRFDTALTLAIAGLSNTGPLSAAAFAAGEGPLTLPDAAKVIYAATMVIGRLEAVALIALFNPGFWRG